MLFQDLPAAHRHIVAGDKAAQFGGKEKHGIGRIFHRSSSTQRYPVFVLFLRVLCEQGFDLWGQGETGGDDISRDVIRADLDRQVTREAQHSGFGRCIGVVVGSGLVYAYRINADDPAPATRLHAG